MKLLLLFCGLLPSVLSTSFGSISAVITSQDVWNGKTSTTELMPGWKYRVYAVYASSAPSNDYASKVTITGADNTQYTVASLSRPKGNTDYFLDETIILTAPITISDNNAAPGTGIPARVSYTIYIVSTNFAVAPVVSAQLVNGNVDCSLAKSKAPSCTVLSAEMAFQLSSIDTSTINSMYIKNAGYDQDTDAYTVMAVSQQAPGSSIMIAGPIATLYNATVTSANFGFALRRDGVWSSSITPGASTTLLSNGYLSVGEAYSMAINQNTLTRNYDFGKNTDVAFNPIVGNYYPDQGDSVMLSCLKDNGPTIDYDCAEKAGSVVHETCKSLVLKVVVGTRTVEGTRFKVEIESKSSAFSTSLFTLLIASIFGVIKL